MECGIHPPKPHGLKMIHVYPSFVERVGHRLVNRVHNGVLMLMMIMHVPMVCTQAVVMCIAVVVFIQRVHSLNRTMRSFAWNGFA